MSMKEWAEREVELACKRENPNRKEGEWDYGCACYESALKAYNSLLEDGHSGMSWNFTTRILERLMQSLPLTPIEDSPDIWKECGFKSEDGATVYQCQRMYSLFKNVYDDGTVIYKDNDRVAATDGWHTYHFKLANKIVNELHPITMPYIPAKEPYRVKIYEYLSDKGTGDFDTVNIIDCTDPEGRVTPVHRYFKYDKGDPDWVEISAKKFYKRSCSRTNWRERR